MWVPDDNEHGNKDIMIENHQYNDEEPSEAAVHDILTVIIAITPMVAGLELYFGLSSRWDLVNRRAVFHYGT